MKSSTQKIGKTQLAFLLIASLVVSGLTMMTGAQSAMANSYTLKFSEIGPPRGPRAEALKWWAEEVEKRSKGDIKIKFFWSQSLVKSKATLKAVGSGLAEMGTINGVYTPASLPLWNLANAPFTIRDPWVGMRVWHEMRERVPELVAEAAKNNVKILFNYATGPMHLLSVKKPIKTLEDLKGMKLRATGGAVQLLSSLGAVPVKMGFGEIYAALDRGTIDGSINYTPFIKSYKHFEVADHATEVYLGQVLGYGGGINLKLFNKMSKDHQALLLETGKEFMDVYGRLSVDGAESAKKELMAGIDGHKVSFYTLPDEERNRWIKQVGSGFVDTWVLETEKRGIDAKKILATFEEVLGKYESELKEKGYPWAR